MNQSKNRELTSTILKALGLAMGIAVFVLNILENIDNNTSIRLLSIGMIAYGLYLFRKEAN